MDSVGQVVRVRYGVDWQGQTSVGSPAGHSNRPESPTSATSEATLDFSQSFDWDALGNRRWMVQQDSGGSSLTLRNQLEGLNRYTDVAVDSGASGSGFSSIALATNHDCWGRVTRDHDQMYDWDPEGRLRTVRRADDGTTVATYVYDAHGRRISRTVWVTAESITQPEHTLRYVWNGDRVIEEWLVLPGDGPSGLGQLVAEYIWGAPAPNGLLAQRRDNAYPQVWDPVQALHQPWTSEVENDEWTYPLVDNRGNTRAVVSEVARVVERWVISATGLPLIVSGTDGSLTGLGDGLTAQGSGYGNALLTGHHWDPIARWHYAWHRWISPLTYGRFTSHSPLTYPVAELNYEWVFNNGWEWVDLDGLEETRIVI